MIAIIDYEMGNLCSVQKGMEKAGFAARITGDPEEFRGADGLVLPGVGAFADAMEVLNRKGLSAAITKAVNAGKPLLGICLGMQLLFTDSEENGEHQGIGLIPGKVCCLPEEVKVPHMGWNEVCITSRESMLFQKVPDRSYFYFVHSYYVKPRNAKITAAKTAYGVTFTSAVEQGLVCGTQFHPEKSSDIGIQVLRNFGEWVKRC